MRQGGPSSLPRAAAPSFAPRAHGPTRPDPSGRGGAVGGGRRRGGGAVGPPPAVAAGRPGGPGLPAPRSPRSLLQRDFLFAAAGPGLASRAGKPPKAASFSQTPPPSPAPPPPLAPEPRPPPGSPAARHQRALRGHRPLLAGGQPFSVLGNQPGEGQLDAKSVFVLSAQSSLQAPNPEPREQTGERSPRGCPLSMTQAAPRQGRFAHSDRRSSRLPPPRRPPASPSQHPDGGNGEGLERAPGLRREAEAPRQHHLLLPGDLGQVHLFLHSFHTVRAPFICLTLATKHGHCPRTPTI